ncbi:MAG: hypothetical protein HY681_12465 [Chloroflexi bacterium]|nr:hypothetical protein [Chloroflexota bacterium]
MRERLLSAFWVPVAAVLLAVGLIAGIGEALLALAGAREEMAGVKEPYAVAGALLLALFVLIGAAALVRSGHKR